MEGHDRLIASLKEMLGEFERLRELRLQLLRINALQQGILNGRLPLQALPLDEIEAQARRHANDIIQRLEALAASHGKLAESLPSGWERG